jgi:hypothetical protein
MTERETIRRALQDAIGWQDGLAAAHGKDQYGEQARAQAARYRALLLKRYGTDKLPAEAALDHLPTIDIWELSRQHQDVEIEGTEKDPKP